MAIVVAIAGRGTNERQEVEGRERLRRIQEATDQLQVHLSQARLPLYQGALPLMLKKHESPLLCAPAVLAEERAIRSYDGTTVHLHKSISSTSGTSQSHGVLKPIDSGQLVLTTKRLVFVGALRTASTDLRKLISAEVVADSIRVNREGRAKAETYVTENPVAYSVIINLLATDLIAGVSSDALLLRDNVTINLNQIG